MSVRVAFVAVFRMVTATPGMMPPCASVTTPWMDPVDDWANKAVDKLVASTAHTISRKRPRGEPMRALLSNKSVGWRKLRRGPGRSQGRIHQGLKSTGGLAILLARD